MAAETTLPNVERANRLLESLWRRGLLPRPILEPEALKRAAGARRLVHGWWCEPFERLLAAARDEAALSPLGESMAWGQIVMSLKARVRAQALWAAHPELPERPVRSPIIILGQMRAGTTRLQRLLACDARFSHTRTFESLDPVPRRGRLLRARAALAMLRRFNPEVARIHPTWPSAPEEEFGYFSFSFGPAQFEAQWRVPSFSRWWEEADTRPLYREFRMLVQTNAWARGDPPDRPMILKAPHFLQDLPELLEAFPDARLIRLHRPLDQVVASSASLVWNQMRIQSDRADKGWIGREWLRKTRLREQRAEGATPSACLHVGYEAMSGDWRGEMGRIYDHLGLELTPDVERGMEAYLGGARAHRGHRYALEEFELGAADIACLGGGM